MDWQGRIVAVVVAAALSACSQHRQVQAEAETAGPQFANLCIKQSNWPRLINYMKKYGVDHDLEFHGGIDHATPDGRPEFNAYLAQGYSYYFGDDFDLWFTSDPFREDVVTLGGIVKEQPISLDQQRLADGILAYIADISSSARGPMDNPSCIQVPPVTNVRFPPNLGHQRFSCPTAHPICLGSIHDFSATTHKLSHCAPPQSGPVSCANDEGDGANFAIFRGYAGASSLAQKHRHNREHV